MTLPCRNDVAEGHPPVFGDPFEQPTPSLALDWCDVGISAAALQLAVGLIHGGFITALDGLFDMPLDALHRGLQTGFAAVVIGG